MLPRHLHAAAQDLDQVRDDLALENPGVVRLQAVQNLPPDGHDALVLRVPGQLHAAKGAVALHDVNLPAFHVLRPAVHKLLHPVGDVHAAGELFLDAQPGLLRLLPAALVQKHLPGDFLRVEVVFNQVNLQVGPEELRHGLLDKLIGNGLFRLVFVTGLGGEVAGDQNQTVLHVRPGDLALVLLVLPLLPEVLVHGGDKGGAAGLLRASPVLQEA